MARAASLIRVRYTAPRRDFRILRLKARVANLKPGGVRRTLGSAMAPRQWDEVRRPTTRRRYGGGTRCDVRRRGGATAVGRGGTSDDAERRNLSRALLFQLEVYSSTLSDSFRGNVVFKPSTSVVAAVECGVADLDDRLRKAERARNEPSRGGALGEGTSTRKVTSGAEVEGRRFLGPGFYYVLDPVSFQMRVHAPGSNDGPCLSRRTPNAQSC